MNTTDTFWDVSGTSLNTLAWNIRTLGGQRDGVPTFRGENRKAGRRRGASWRAKRPDQKLLTMDMWVLGSDADGLPPTDVSRRSLYKSNLDALRGLFWRDDAEQVLVTKRWENAAGAVVSASAWVEIASAMEPQMMGPYGASLSVDLLMADPFWYGAQVTVPLAVGANALTVAGTARTERVAVDLVGPLTGPTSVTIGGIGVVYAAAVASGQTVTLDCDMFTALESPSGANVIGDVVHSGDTARWLVVPKGSISAVMASGGGAGSVALRYLPAYL